MNAVISGERRWPSDLVMAGDDQIGDVSTDAHASDGR
jgi:hypothetical protein